MACGWDAWGSRLDETAPAGRNPLHWAVLKSSREFVELDLEEEQRGEIFEHWRHCLAQNDVAIESRVDWPRGGASLYFRDPDGHLLELITPGCWAIY